MAIQPNNLTVQLTQFSSLQLARWGLLDSVRREVARDRLITQIASPPEALMNVLIRQWMDREGLDSPQMLEDWQRQRQLNSELFTELVSREWRWQRWCESYGDDNLLTYFLSRKEGLDKVSYWHFVCDHKDFAAEIYQRLREGEVSFDRLHLEESVATSSAEGGHCLLQLIGPVEIENVSNDLQALLKSSEVGVLWSPRPSKDGSWQIVRLEERHTASLDASMRGRLFAEIGEAVLRQEQESL